MKPQRVLVSHHKDEGFSLIVEEYSYFRSGVAWVADKLCVLTRHHFCNSGPLSWGMNQDFDHSTRIVSVPIDRETADKLSGENAWTWLDD